MSRAGHSGAGAPAPQRCWGARARAPLGKGPQREAGSGSGSWLPARTRRAGYRGRGRPHRVAYVAEDLEGAYTAGPIAGLQAAIRSAGSARRASPWCWPPARASPSPSPSTARPQPTEPPRPADANQAMGGCASRESSARRSRRPRGGRVTARPRPRRGPRRPRSWPARHHGPVWPRGHFG